MYESILAWMPAGADWIYILVVVLVLFGAKKLPELARGVGKSMGEFKKARDDFENEIKRGEEDSDEEAKKPSSEKAKDA